jgi:hypothetical protein
MTTINGGNRFLSLEEMTPNAQYIMDYLTSRGWTRQSVAGMLGNMQTESTINPQIWQGLHSYASTPYVTVQGQGYGLVQWTPFNKYTIWARDNGYPYSWMDSQLKRIEYEVANNIQWFGGYSGEMSFAEFTQSVETPTYLAQVFISTYEHPADPIQPSRGTQAEYWYSTLLDHGGEPPPPPEQENDPPINMMNNLYPLLLSDALNGWKG